MGNDETTHEPTGIPERIGDSSSEHARAAGADGTVNRTGESLADATETEADRTSSVLDAPGVPDTAAAASGPTQATTSGGGRAPAAGQESSGEVTHAGLTDSVGASEEVAEEPGMPGSSTEPGANGGLSSEADPVTELAEELGLAPGATDAVDPGQDNGLNS